MNKILSACVAALLAVNLAYAQAPADCEAKAVGKNGKPLAGAAKTSFMKKCQDEAASGGASTCENKAVDKNGKPLAGAAKASFIKKCEAEAGK